MTGLLDEKLRSLLSECSHSSLVRSVKFRGSGVKRVPRELALALGN